MVAALTAVCLATCVYAQGTFQNLGFEAANVPVLPAGQPAFINVTDALPGWTAYIGTNQATQVAYNGVSLGGAVVGLVDLHTSFFSNNVIAGNFTANLYPGYYPPDAADDSAAIAQTGLIPGAARSLLFDANDHISQLVVTFNGQNLPFFLLSTSSNFQTYGADISGFAGVSGELRFTQQPIFAEFPIVWLDNIRFSSIPEPCTVSFLALGALLLGGRVLGRRR